MKQQKIRQHEAHKTTLALAKTTNAMQEDKGKGKGLTAGTNNYLSAF